MMLPRDLMKAVDTLNLIRTLRDSDVLEPQAINVFLDRFDGLAKQDGADPSREAVDKAVVEASRVVDRWLSGHQARGCDVAKGRIVARPDIQNGGMYKELRCECGEGAEVREMVRREPAGMVVTVQLRPLPREVEYFGSTSGRLSVEYGDTMAEEQEIPPARERPTGRAPLALGEEV